MLEGSEDTPKIYSAMIQVYQGMKFRGGKDSSDCGKILQEQGRLPLHVGLDVRAPEGI
jgi:hypothetical protein